MTSTQRREQRTMPLRELTSSTLLPVATISTNLMPPEVLAKRRVSWLKRRLGFALIALVALVGLGYAVTAQSTASSRDDLAIAESETAGLQKRLTAYDTIVRLQGETAAVRSQLRAAMAGDLRWSNLLAKLGKVAPGGLVISDVAGTVGAEGNDSAPAPGAYSSGGPRLVGKLDISGTAKDYRSIATFVKRLAAVPGVGSVAPGSLGFDNGQATYSISIGISTAALGGRYTTGVK